MSACQDTSKFIGGKFQHDLNELFDPPQLEKGHCGCVMQVFSNQILDQSPFSTPLFRISSHFLCSTPGLDSSHARASVVVGGALGRTEGATSDHSPSKWNLIIRKAFKSCIHTLNLFLFEGSWANKLRFMKVWVEQYPSCIIINSSFCGMIWILCTHVTPIHVFWIFDHVFYFSVESWLCQADQFLPLNSPLKEKTC